jgi:hypothetical protein
MRDREFLRLSRSAEAKLISAARDAEPVRGLTHGFYKYPARFSPVFARTVIETFTKSSDLVLDPYVGGGTTIVEARAAGREAVGVDISALAEFVSNVKCTIYSEQELNTLQRWARRVGHAIDIHRASFEFINYAEQGYYKHLDHPSRWRLRKAIEQALWSAIALGTPRLESFGRCAVLRAAQWALDGRSNLPKVSEFREFLEETARNMVVGARELREAVKENGRQPFTMIHRSAAGLDNEFRSRGLRTPRLILTSPPYPGVHVLYHRWQVDGRKEAPMPFLIANKLDGAGARYYTMGDRRYPKLRTYFDSIRATMSSVAALADNRTIIVQMLAFSEPGWQLSRYLETMQETGLREVKFSMLRNESDGRLWRSVPGRRWYSDQRGDTPGSNEVVLVHRKIVSADARDSLRLPSRASSEVSAGA